MYMPGVGVCARLVIEKSTRIFLPSRTVSVIEFLASVASSTLSKVRKAKPRDWPDFPSRTTLHFSRGPYLPNSFSKSLDEIKIHPEVFLTFIFLGREWEWTAMKNGDENFTVDLPYPSISGNLNLRNFLALPLGFQCMALTLKIQHGTLALFLGLDIEQYLPFILDYGLRPSR